VDQEDVPDEEEAADKVRLHVNPHPTPRAHKNKHVYAHGIHAHHDPDARSRLQTSAWERFAQREYIFLSSEDTDDLDLEGTREMSGPLKPYG
jgi:hypothetical protein